MRKLIDKKIASTIFELDWKITMRGKYNNRLKIHFSWIKLVFDELGLYNNQTFTLEIKRPVNESAKSKGYYLIDDEDT